MVQFNALLGFFLFIFVAASLTRWVLTRMNISHLRRFGHEAPSVFRNELDEETLSRMTDYTIESSHLESLESLFDDVMLLVVLLSGVLAWLAAVVTALHLHMILSGLLFFAVLSLVSTVLEVPFNLYSTFGIEKKYGFSTMTPGLWISDFLKSFLISAVIMSLLLTPLLALIQCAPQIWWLWAWVFFALLQLLLLWL